MFLSWWRRTARPSSPTGRGGKAGPRPFRPGLEVLEGRWVPTVTVTNTEIPLGKPTQITITASDFVDGDITDKGDLPFGYLIRWGDGSGPTVGTFKLVGNQLEATVMHRFLKPVTSIDVTETELGEGTDSADQQASVKISFPTAAQMEADPTVANAMRDLWTDTLNYAWDHHHILRDDLRREEGFWIEYNSLTGTFAVSPPQYQNPPSRPDQYGSLSPSKVHDNPGQYTFVVGLFHTHTPMTWVNKARVPYRDLGPSDDDKTVANTIMMPVFAYDYTTTPFRGPRGQVVVPAGYPWNASATVWKVGPDQRPDTELTF